ncbi:GRAM domain-containing protein 1B [Armadillidium nasatum]|uniref:GRAM domain-containing protein 1B n=1 Tax=Armadillidium nasatum TaxID=96803 RepID=A0A5N5THE0_9CRUS|nr:GRAM domain-containing protein 1B [Armadillidium nasatum]
MEFSGLNKSSNENFGNEKSLQSASSSSKPQCHSNNGFRSSENLLNTEGHKIKTEGGESGDGESSKTCQRLQSSVSASHLVGSPVFLCSNLSPGMSTPNENNVAVPVCCLNHDGTPDQNSEIKSCSCDLMSNSPLHKNSGIPEDNDDKLSSNFTPSPNFRSNSKIHLASGESSDERGDRKEKNIAVPSREGSFERSVSFQENNFLDAEKSNDHLQVSDSNRSLDLSRSVDASSPHSVSSSTKDKDRDRKESKESKIGDKDKDKKSKKASWYNVLNPTYKSRSEELKKLFKDLPSDERLIVDYSCALQKDILVHGRLYVTSNYFSFYSKIFGWETFLSIRCKDIVALTKEKTALVIPNALQINTDTDKHFFTSFAARDKTYLMLFRIWQNALMDQVSAK